MIDTNIQSKLTQDERDLFDAIMQVVNNSSPSTNVFAVGGWVRDKLLGKESHDVDLMIDNMTGEKFATLVTNQLGAKGPHVIQENPEKSKHITTAKAFIPLPSGTVQEVDFAQARQEVYHGDSRIPDVQPATPQEDAHRRDLTINSIFYHINKNTIVDYTGMGLKDLITLTMRTPEEPTKTFMDDPLRMFRVIRFAARYGGTIDPSTLAAMNDPRLREEVNQKVSKERIGQEFKKMMGGENPQIALQLLKDTGLFQDLIDQALKGSKYEGKIAPLDMDQNNPYHKLNVWEHTMEVLKNSMDMYDGAEEDKRIVMALSTLMHDMGKLFYEIHAIKPEHGTTSYHGHEDESWKMAELILRYIKIEGPIIQQVSGIVKHHMYPHRFTEGEATTLKSMRKFIRKMGEDSLNWLDVFNHAVADAYSKDKTIDPAIVTQYQQLESRLQEALMSMAPPTDKATMSPVVNGKEIMDALNIKGGPWMSEITEFIKELQDDNPEISKEDAITQIIDRFQGLDTTQQARKAMIASSSDGENDDVKISEHLFKAKQEELNGLIRSGHNFQALSVLKELKNDHGNDERVVRALAFYMFNILLKDQNLKDDDIMSHIANKTNKYVTDTTLKSYYLGTQILTGSSVDEDTLANMGNDVIKLSPGAMRSVIDKLPKEVKLQKVRDKLSKNLNELPRH